MYQIHNQNEEEALNLVQLLKECAGNIYTMGVGKSGNMAKHFADLLKSISVPCYYLETTNALHGDIGPLESYDYVILFSKSGNTRELIELFPYLKSRKCKLIGIVCDKNSKFVEIFSKYRLFEKIVQLWGKISP